MQSKAAMLEKKKERREELLKMPTFALLRSPHSS